MLLMQNVVLKCNRSCYLSQFGQENPPGLVPSRTASVVSEPGAAAAGGAGQSPALWGCWSGVQRVLPAGAARGTRAGGPGATAAPGSDAAAHPFAGRAAAGSAAPLAPAVLGFGKRWDWGAGSSWAVELESSSWRRADGVIAVVMRT